MAREPQASRIRIDGADNLASMKPRRSRDKDHLRFIARQPCTLCGRQPCEAHHLRFSQSRALGRRVSDEFTVPLCRVHHRELHRQGDERGWWKTANIDPMPIALKYWQQTRGVVPAVSSNREPQDRKTEVSIEEPSGVGASSNGNVPRRLWRRSRRHPMTSFEQFEANRRNALRSTGPKTDDGKRRSRVNAVRHGLTAETVVGSLEDAEDYKAFEAAIISDYCAETAVARELVLRLASLLWRLRRATAIETDLLEIQAEALRERRLAVPPDRRQGPYGAVFRAFEGAVRTAAFKHPGNGSWPDCDERTAEEHQPDDLDHACQRSYRQSSPIDLLLPASCQSRQRRVRAPQPL